jgi:hypothetical protein
MMRKLEKAKIGEVNLEASRHSFQWSTDELARFTPEA